MSNFDNLVNAARDFACGLYKQQPGALIPNVGESVLRFAWDRLCDYPDNPGLPPSPDVPFQGGQCNCVLYDVSIFNDVSTGSGELIGAFGEIGGVRIVLIPRPDGEFSASYEILCRGFPNQIGGCGNYQWYRYRFSPFLPNAQNTRNAINSITRTNGQPDNCGNPPEQYPPGAVPPGGFTSPPVSIPLGDGDVINVNFNFSPPAASLDKIPPIVINYIQPQLNVNLKVPIEFNFNGEINIGTPSSPPATLPPDIINNINNTNNNTEKVNNNFNDYRKNYDYYFNPPQLDNDPETNKEDYVVEEGKDEDKEGVIGIRINLTNLPDKAQFGYPSVFFAGWMSFKRDEGYMPRQQINFQDSFFLAPPGVRGYSITFTNGATGAVRVYSKASEN